MQCSQYNVILKGQFNPHAGTLTLQVHQGDVEGFFEFNGQKSHFQGKVLRRNRYVASVNLQLYQSTQDCDLLLTLRDDQMLLGGLVDQWGCWPLEGTPSAKRGG